MGKRFFIDIFRFFLIVLLPVFVSGCGPELIPEPSDELLCPGKDGPVEGFEALRSSYGVAESFKAYGSCKISYVKDDDVKRENLNSKLWFVPPGDLYFYGDTLGGFVNFGSSDEHFWFRTKPDGFYVWSDWPSGLVEVVNIKNCIRGRIGFCPSDIVETFTGPDVGRDWLFYGIDGDDVFESPGYWGWVKKVYVERCNYLARRIEYRSPSGRVLTVAEVGDYTKVGGMKVPTSVVIRHYVDGEEKRGIDIDFNNIVSFEPSRKQLDELFDLPDTAGFDELYRLDEDCDLVEDKPGETVN